MKADHNTIMPVGVKVMSKYKVLSKREHGVIKNVLFKILFFNIQTLSCSAEGLVFVALSLPAKSTRLN